MTRPTYVLGAAVPSGNRIRRFFDDGRDSVIYALEHPPSFRWAGFDLTTLDRARAVGTDCYEVRSGDRKVLQIFQDGALFGRFAADSDFLGWGQEPEEFDRLPRLNPVAVIECNTSFVHLYGIIISKLISPPSEVHFNLQLRHAAVGDRRLALTEYYEHGIRNVFKPRLYMAYDSNPEANLTIDSHLLIEKPQVVAYKVISAFYSFFELSENSIPFTRECDGDKEIDISAIKAL